MELKQGIYGEMICSTWALTKHGTPGWELKNHYLFARLSHIIT